MEGEIMKNLLREFEKMVERDKKKIEEAFKPLEDLIEKGKRAEKAIEWLESHPIDTNEVDFSEIYGILKGES